MTLTGVILAGGQGRRMGGRDKGLVTLDGKPLYQHVLERLRPQVDIVMISANRHLDQYQLSGCKVIEDSLPDYPGPLGGILSALQMMPGEWAAFCACDTPAIPLDYVSQLRQHCADAPAVWVQSTMRDHPVLALVNRSLTQPLENYLATGQRRLMHFLLQQGGHPVRLNHHESAFRNINTPEDLTGDNQNDATPAGVYRMERNR